MSLRTVMFMISRFTRHTVWRVNSGGEFLFSHWTSPWDCPRFVNEPPPFMLCLNNLHGPLFRCVPDRWLASFYMFARNPKQRIDIRGLYRTEKNGSVKICRR